MQGRWEGKGQGENEIANRHILAKDHHRSHSMCLAHSGGTWQGQWEGKGQGENEIAIVLLYVAKDHITSHSMLLAHSGGTWQGRWECKQGENEIHSHPYCGQ